MMKKLLLLAFMAVASEAMAQDAQCVPERAAILRVVVFGVLAARSNCGTGTRKPSSSASSRRVGRVGASDSRG